MLIEEDRSKVDTLSLEFHDAIMQGNGSTVEVLREAGANRADVVVATTGNDEDNLVICQVVKLMFLRPRTIARVTILGTKSFSLALEWMPLSAQRRSSMP